MRVIVHTPLGRFIAPALQPSMQRLFVRVELFLSG